MTKKEYLASLYAGLDLRVEPLASWGYDCSAPANFFLETAEHVDGRKVGHGRGTGMYAAVEPGIGYDRFPIRVYGDAVTLIAPASWAKDAISGSKADIVAFLRRYAAAGDWNCYTNEGAVPHWASYHEKVLREAELLERLDISGFPTAPTGPLVRRAPHTGHRAGVLRD